MHTGLRPTQQTPNGAHCKSFIGACLTMMLPCHYWLSHCGTTSREPRCLLALTHPGGGRIVFCRQYTTPSSSSAAEHLGVWVLCTGVLGHPEGCWRLSTCFPMSSTFWHQFRKVISSWKSREESRLPDSLSNLIVHFWRHVWQMDCHLCQDEP